jgi:hypothetical protein
VERAIDRRRYWSRFSAALVLYLLPLALAAQFAAWIIGAVVFAFLFLWWASRRPRTAALALGVWVALAAVVNLVAAVTHLSSSDGLRQVLTALIDGGAFWLCLDCVRESAAFE